MRDAIQRYSGKVTETLEVTFHNVIGKVGENLSLGTQSGFDQYTTEAARFFADGRWLLKNGSQDHRDYTDIAKEYLVSRESPDPRPILSRPLFADLRSARQK